MRTEGNMSKLQKLIALKEKAFNQTKAIGSSLVIRTKELVSRFSKKQEENSIIEQELQEVKPSAPIPMWKKKSVIIASAICLAVTGTVVGVQQHKIQKEKYIAANTFEIFHVYKDGVKIGSVDTKDQVNKLIADLKLELANNNPGLNMVLDTGEITFESEVGFQLYADATTTLASLKDSFTSHAVGVAIMVDGKQVGVAKDEATAASILDRIQSVYAPELVEQKKSSAVSTMSFKAADAETTEAEASANQSTEPKPSKQITEVAFVEEVAVDEVALSPEKIEDADAIYERIVQGSTKPTSYTVQKGDCVGCIAQKFDISTDIIYENNPWIKDDKITIGDKLDLTVRMPDITVKTIETVVEVAEIATPIEYRKNDKMKSGEQKTIQEGSPGSQKLTYKVTKENGYIITEELAEKEVLVEAVPKVVEKGTMIVKGTGTGQFAYPVSNYKITSKFGTRWGRQHAGVDFIGNSSIKASDGGKVTFVGTKSGYGKTIIIDHGNGFETLYGHLKSYSVSEGDKVDKGDKIGVMGNTGRSTGTHLHFEIRKNGKAVNPLSYL